MPLLSYETRKFSTSLTRPASGTMSVSLAELVWGAVTVGATPISMGGTPRPLLELSWRAAMAAASVEEDRWSGRWVITDGYRRLDPSEKRAVSYFLGMTQAKIMCQRLLHAPHLLHLDAYLAMTGGLTRASRPDLIGLSLPAMDITIAVEAKGRTGGRDDGVTRRAKEQARSLPGVLSTSSALRVASVASFDSRGWWQAYLEDPPGPFQPLDSLTAGALLAAYYRPLAAAVLEAGVQISDDDATTLAQLPGIDLVLGLPTVIVTAMRALPLAGLVTTGQLQDVGATLLEGVPSLSFVSRARTASRAGDEEDVGGPQGRLSPFTGLDGVYIRLGPSWTRPPS